MLKKLTIKVIDMTLSHQRQIYFTCSQRRVSFSYLAHVWYEILEMK